MGNKEELEVEKMIEDKIGEMEDEGYEYPKRFSKGDYIFTSVVVIVCLAIVIAGAFIK